MRLFFLLSAQAVSVLAFTAATWSPFDFLDNGEQLPLNFANPFKNDEPITIYKMLSNDERFTRLTKAINFVDGVAERLDDEDVELTFFAPPDETLGRPHENDTRPLWPAPESASHIDLADALVLLEDHFADDTTGVDHHKPDKETRKKILKIILRALLEYHILPAGALDLHDLGKNQTFSTNLTIPGTLDSDPQRIRVQQKFLPPSTFINFYSRVTFPDLKASNGLVHVIDHPLIPPPSAFDGLFLFPHFFSTFTSVLQRTGLTKEVDLRWKHDKGWKGADAITVFAPTNHAFDRLPRKLQLYLFSPLGARALKKLTQYHIIPNSILFTDFVKLNNEDGASVAPACDGLTSNAITSRFQIPAFGRLLRGEANWSTKEAFSNFDVIINATFKLDTLLTNHTVDAQVLKKKITYPFPGPKKPARYETTVFVNDHPVLLADIPARNGAIHVVPKLLNPCRKRHEHDGEPHEPHHPHHPPPHHPHEPHYPHDPHHPHHPPHGDPSQDDDWENWEFCLPRWAEEGD